MNDKKLELIEKQLEIQTNLLDKLLEQYSRLYKMVSINNKALIQAGLVEMTGIENKIDG